MNTTVLPPNPEWMKCEIGAQSKQPNSRHQKIETETYACRLVYKRDRNQIFIQQKEKLESPRITARLFGWNWLQPVDSGDKFPSTMTISSIRICMPPVRRRHRQLWELYQLKPLPVKCLFSRLLFPPWRLVNTLFIAKIAFSCLFNLGLTEWFVLNSK